MLTEASELQLRTTQLQNAFERLTPELSRPVAGRRTRASVAHSTWLTPRHGVGLNELLGLGPLVYFEICMECVCDSGRLIWNCSFVVKKRGGATVIEVGTVSH